MIKDSIPFRTLIIVLLLPLLFSSSVFAQKLIIDIKAIDNSLCIKASINDAKQVFTIPEQIDVITKMKTIYSMFEYRQTDIQHLEFSRRNPFKMTGKLDHRDNSEPYMPENQNDDIHMLLKNLGHEIYGPIRDLVEKALEIEFIISKECIYFPFDALYFNGKQLFLQKPILYNLNGLQNSQININKNWKGFMVSEMTADPDRGVLLIKKILPESQYFDSSEVYLKDFNKARDIDFIIISTHGGVKSMYLDHITVFPKHLAVMEPKLVYLDSCTLGVSYDFLYCLQKEGIQYFLGPILSNEDGNSSTITMKGFFTALLRGEKPSQALFSTRKALYNRFKLQKNSFSMLMFRAFTFRIYRLN